MELFNLIVQIITEIWQSVWPFYIIDEYERGLVLRWGKYHKVVEPGLHIKSFIADRVLVVHIATETISTKPQSLTTLDGKSISISLVIKYNIGDDEESLKKYLLKVRDVNDAIDDIAMTKAKDYIMTLTWQQCKDASIDNEISKKTRVEAKRWGINIDYVAIVQIAESFNLRLIQ